MGSFFMLFRGVVVARSNHTWFYRSVSHINASRTRIIGFAEGLMTLQRPL
jgi:hypothetical protein